MPPTHPDYQRLKELVLRARALPPADRDAFLTEELRDDPALAREARALLAHDEVPDIPSGETVGPYHILRKLGEGGMGVVYEAEQREPIQRRVALKRLRAGFTTPRQIARFETERQALAVLTHPGIARIHDAGTDDRERPYVVMELIDGVPLNTYCDGHRLGVRERIRLFLQVCGAIQHAHQRGIMHRDLKPSNLLVTDADGSPQVKVIDFGIARGFNAGGAGDRPGMTSAGELVGTPQYMSPEQASGLPHTIDSRTDVYSLGVVLYELLTGSPPFPEARFQDVSLSETLRIIQEESPPRPSTLIRRSTADDIGPARLRRTDPENLQRMLRGELDWILLCCLAKLPDERYPSVLALQEDLERFLNHRPVEAGPPDLGYRIRKFAQRNRATVAGGTLLAIAIVAGVVGTAWQAVRASRERAVAEERLRDVQALANSFLFDVHDQVRELPGSIPVRRTIARNASSILAGMSAREDDPAPLREPLMAAYLRLGIVQRDLGHMAASDSSLRRVIEMAETGLARHPDRPQEHYYRSSAYRQLALLQEATTDPLQALEQHALSARIVTELLETHPDSAAYHDLRSRAYKSIGFNLVRVGRAEESLAAYDTALVALERRLALDPGDPNAEIEMATLHSFRAEALGELGRGQEALDAYTRSRDEFKSGWEEAPNNLRLLNRYAVVEGAVAWQLAQLGRHEEAVGVMERSLGLKKQLSDLNPENVKSRRDYGRGFLSLGEQYMGVSRWKDARRAFRQGRAICDSLARADSTDFHSQRYLASLYHAEALLEFERGNLENSDALLDRAAPLDGMLLREQPNRDDHRTRQATGHALRGRIRARRAETGGGTQAWREARDCFRRGIDILEELDETGRLADYLQDDLEDMKEQRAACDAALRGTP